MGKTLTLLFLGVGKDSLTFAQKLLFVLVRQVLFLAVAGVGVGIWLFFHRH